MSTWGWGRTVAFILVTATVGALAVGSALLLLVRGVGGLVDDGPLDGLAGPADPPADEAPGALLDGVEEFDVLSNQHVETRVDYDQVPPVGGDHLPVWQDCGFYEGEVLPEAAVHSLEHGAVWVTYDPDLPDDEVAELRRLASVNPYLLVTPRTDLDSPVVASAWGVQLRLGSADDDRLGAFLTAYQQGPQTPEPGAPCWGGISQTAERLGTV